MKTWSLRASRTLTVAATATVVGLASAACQAGAQSAASASATSSQTAPTTPAKAAPTGESKFPSTNLDVVFTGQDATNKLVEFQKVVQDPASPTAHLVPDPSDPAVHELPMASDAEVKSLDPNGFPFETCPPTSCTVDTIMDSVIGDYNDAFYAHIHVNAADQIDSVAQSAH